MPIPVFRFAPSPNGWMHAGHALSAILNHDLARTMGGRFLLRIEDIDPARAREEHVEQIFTDLAWLGLTWELPVRRQSRHMADYKAAADRLMADGLLYACYATRKDIDAATGGGAADPDDAPLVRRSVPPLPVDETERRRAAGEPYALRLDMTRALANAAKLGHSRFSFHTFDPDGHQTESPADPGRWGDPVIVRKETPTSYHLSVVVDDAIQGISHVVRGTDLLAATDLHRLLQILLGLPAPSYFHHRLITDPAGRKLSKSVGDSSLASLRQAGVTAAALRAQVLTALQTSFSSQ